MEMHLPHGHVAHLDDEDYARLSAARWYVNQRGYVVAHIEGRIRPLHRLVMGADPEQIVDHKSGDKLDNRRANLRICTHAENMRNRKTHKNNQCGVKGVYLDRAKKVPRYRAQIRVDGKKIQLGSYPTISEAQSAYESAARKFHCEFASPQGR